MSDGTAIEWSDATWNFLVGCSKVSAGCANCYAIRTVSRMATFPHNGERYEGLTTKLPVLNWTGEVRVFPDKLDLPKTWTKPRRIFVNSMSDLFHEGVTKNTLAVAFGVMAQTPQHTYQVLTKRPERMAAWVGAADARERVAWEVARDKGMPIGQAIEETPWPLPNVWLGTSTEDQRTADERIPHLLRTPAAVRFLSCEPLLGPVDLSCRRMVGHDESCERLVHLPNGDSIGWVITGGESGPKARPMDPQWARDIRDQCLSAGVAFFHKQNGGRTAKANGRLLDGVEWSQFPETRQRATV